MKKVNSYAYIGIILLIAFALGSLGYLINIGVCITAVLAIFLIAKLIVAYIPANKATAFVSRGSGDLHPQHIRTGYWITWGIYKRGEISKLLNATVNPYLITVTGQSKDYQTITIKATMNAVLFSAYRHLKYITIGEDDVAQAMTDDFKNTVRNLIGRYSADELLSKENVTAQDLQDQAKTDSLSDTLNRVGYRTISFTIDDVIPSDDYVKANASLEQARRIAKAAEFDNQEDTKLSDSNTIKYVLGKIVPRISYLDLKNLAMAKLNWTESNIDSHEKEAILLDEMITIGANKANLDPDKFEELMDKGELRVNIRKGRVTAYSGVGNATPILGSIGNRN